MMISLEKLRISYCNASVAATRKHAAAGADRLTMRPSACTGHLLVPALPTVVFPHSGIKATTKVKVGRFSVGHVYELVLQRKISYEQPESE
jgi:hypothetical protein